MRLSGDFRDSYEWTVWAFSFALLVLPGVGIALQSDERALVRVGGAVMAALGLMVIVAVKRRSKHRRLRRRSRSV